jgi:hypothetical protein
MEPAGSVFWGCAESFGKERDIGYPPTPVPHTGAELAIWRGLAPAIPKHLHQYWYIYASGSVYVQVYLEMYRWVALLYAVDQKQRTSKGSHDQSHVGPG